MSKKRGEKVKNIEKRQKFRKPQQNVEKPRKPPQKYRKIVKNVKKQREKIQKC